MKLDGIDIYFDLFMTPKICLYGDLNISSKAVCTLLGQRLVSYFLWSKSNGCTEINQYLGGDANPPYFAAKPPKG